MAPARQTISEAEQMTLDQPIGSDANHESDPHIPDRKSGGNHRYETFALVLAKLASTQRQLSPGQE